MKSREEILKARQDRLDHISESFNKAKEAPVGTVATHGGKKMKKVGSGKWEPVKEEGKKKEGDEKEEALKHNKARASKIMKNLFGLDFEFDFTYKPEGDQIVIHPEGYNPDGTLFDMKDSHREKIIRTFRDKLPKAHAAPNMGGGVTVHLRGASMPKKEIDIKLLASYLKSSTRSITEQISEVADHHNISRTEAIAALAEAEKHIRSEKKDAKIDPSKLSKKELYDAVNKKYNTSFKPGDIEEFEDDEFRVQLDPEDIKNIVDDETK